LQQHLVDGKTFAGLVVEQQPLAHDQAQRIRQACFHSCRAREESK
jgi:hypothetical protein